jgi:hypothetical protein
MVNMVRLRRFSLLAALVAIFMAIGIAAPAQAATSSLPKRPACEQYYLHGIIPIPGKKDCTVQKVYDNFKAFANSYIRSTDPGYRNTAIPAMMYAVFGRYVVNEGTTQKKAVNAVNRDTLNAVIVNINTSTSNSRLACVRDNLLYYLNDATDRSNKVAKGYDFLDWATGTKKFKQVMKAGAPWASAYLELVFKSKGTTEYLGKTAQLRNATTGVGYNCFSA